MTDPLEERIHAFATLMLAEAEAPRSADLDHRDVGSERPTPPTGSPVTALATPRRGSPAAGRHRVWRAVAIAAAVAVLVGVVFVVSARHGRDGTVGTVQAPPLVLPASFDGGALQIVEAPEPTGMTKQQAIVAFDAFFRGSVPEPVPAQVVSGTVTFGAGIDARIEDPSVWLVPFVDPDLPNCDAAGGAGAVPENASGVSVAIIRAPGENTLQDVVYYGAGTGNCPVRTHPQAALGFEVNDITQTPSIFSAIDADHRLTERVEPRLTLDDTVLEPPPVGATPAVDAATALAKALAYRDYPDSRPKVVLALVTSGRGGSQDLPGFPPQPVIDHRLMWVAWWPWTEMPQPFMTEPSDPVKGAGPFVGPSMAFIDATTGEVPRSIGPP